jgi:NDP-sugar pyrophosphorylase family protein
VNAIILSAGRGTRLGPLGLEVPKILVEIDGEPLLARQLRYLARQGVRRVVVNAHHLASQIEAFARTYTGPCELVVVVEATLLGTAGGVRNALSQLGSDPFFVLYGDVLIDVDLLPVLDAHRVSLADATIVVYRTSATEDKGVVEVDTDGFVSEFHEKVPRAGEGFVNAGLYVLQPEFVGCLRRSEPSDFGHDLFPAALKGGKRIRAYEVVVPVLDIGTPANLDTARRRLA